MSRNQKPLTLGEKLRIIEKTEKRSGATKATIVHDQNIPESSLKTILAKKDSVLLNAAKFGLNRRPRKMANMLPWRRPSLSGCVRPAVQESLWMAQF
ncbi:hypothetical protein MRX96_041723 [Rhipicephalus microplus]